jgi:5-formyltetrahydrofolate cyclo-ligase
MDETKPAIRREMRRRRRALSALDMAAAEAAVAAQIERFEPFRASPAVIAYLDTDCEVPTGAILAKAVAAGKRLYLPRLADATLRFVSYEPGAPLRAGAHGIPEPIGEEIDRADLAAAIAIIPLLAWDASGARLGRGGGHYDRAVTGALRPMCLVGLGYAFQQCEALPRDPWDLHLDWVVTERGVVRCGRGDGSPPRRKEGERHHELSADGAGHHRTGHRGGLAGGLRPAATG